MARARPATAGARPTVARLAGRLAAIWLALLAVGWALGALIVAVGPRFDLPVVRGLRAPAHGSLVALARAVSALGSPRVLDAVFVAAVFTLFALGRVRAIGFLALAGPGSLVLHAVLAPLVHRHRPAGPHLGAAQGASWPSGHATESVGLYGALALIAVCGPTLAVRPGPRRLLMTVVAVGLAAIGVSRVVLGVHYPSDVLAGWCLAAVWVGTLYRSVPPVPVNQQSPAPPPSSSQKGHNGGDGRP